jgi:hypothetical protein
MRDAGSGRFPYQALYLSRGAGVAELAYAIDSKSIALYGLVGSNPTSGIAV